MSKADEIKARFAALPPEEQRRRLANLLRALDDDGDEDWAEVMAMSDEEVRAELEADGVDVDAFVARTRAFIEDALAKRKAAQGTKP